MSGKNLVAAMVIVLALVAVLTARGDEPQRAYSCRLYDDEQKKCAFDPKCDQRVVERLKRECLRTAGAHDPRLIGEAH